MDRQPTQERAPRAARPANANRRRRKVCIFCEDVWH